MRRPGKLRNRIDIEEPTQQTNESGETQPTWSIKQTVWASVEPLRGQEAFIAQQVNNEITHKVVMRYTSGITSNMRIDFNGRKLYISSIVDQFERNEYLELTCKERS